MQEELNIFDAPLGWCAMVGRGETLLALTFGHTSGAAATAWLKKILPSVPVQHSVER